MPPGDEDTNIVSLPEDRLGLILDHLDPVTVGQLQKTGRHMYNLIETHQYWRSGGRTSDQSTTQC